MNMFAVIMAGGVGTRFWPHSREKKPKQFLRIFDQRTLIQQTYDRLLPVIPNERIYFVLNTNQKAELLRQIPQAEEENIIIEPFGKNTAPCIGLAALHIQRQDPEAIMVVLPADHLIRNIATFQKVLRVGEKFLQQQDYLVTIGVTPDRPATGYGYIQFSEPIAEIDGIPIYRVKTFAEKPTLDTAQRFLRSGDFVWNSGMFIWKAKIILEEIEEFLPEFYDGLMEIENHIGQPTYWEVVETVYRQIRSISIDYGVMEKSRRVCVIKSDLGWSDVGSWDEVHKLVDKDKNGNGIVGEALVKDSRECLIFSTDKFIAALGVENLIITESEDAILVCHKDQAQNVRELVELLKRKKLKNLI
ncbi:mannose-1-phosphate guanylyltransferase [candidate division KSB1 bacterium]|nr:MAG: mannose-1-phosphate guanylyltransferase [candidate division KSB1 bacterium 4484_219]RKY77468.1 MAG: mannose-1-phosphate guanylyltransferase [candidate division KSB1 bacterium]RKY80228.1 MAG: mannose-1-phosphate guanylyltransferase [candidate division KSB1 bacterium]RKY89433.1 MAG: mannose-1-phosphate guanylyltransferase [candidate division KSB1 bacterium]